MKLWFMEEEDTMLQEEGVEGDNQEDLVWDLEVSVFAQIVGQELPTRLDIPVIKYPVQIVELQ